MNPKWQIIFHRQEQVEKKLPKEKRIQMHQNDPKLHFLSFLPRWVIYHYSPMSHNLWLKPFSHSKYDRLKSAVLRDFYQVKSNAT